MSTQNLLLIGLVGAVIVVYLGSRDWRNSVKCALVLVLIEGAVRKWLLPGGQELIYFLKDFVLVGAYLRFVIDKRGTLSLHFPTLPIGTYLGCCVVVALAALNPNIGSYLAATLGVKNYLIYVPLLVMMPHLFRDSEEAKRQLALYSLLAIPICVLGFLQYQSDAFSVLNTYSQGTAEYGATTFGSSKNVRITGTFSYLTGHTTFVCFFFALCLALISMPNAPFRITTLFVTLPMLVANALMSGSRGALVVQAFVVLGFVMASGVTTSPQFRRAIVTILFGAGIIGLGVRFFFADAAQANVERWQMSSDNFYDRTVTLTVNSISDAWEQAGVGGYGIGATSPAVYALRRVLRLGTPEEQAPLYDLELGQVFVELGLLGFAAWYLFRILVLLAAWRSYGLTKDAVYKPLALAAFLTVGPHILMSVVLNHVAGVFCWAGLGLAVTPLLSPKYRSFKRRSMDDSSVASRVQWHR